MDFYPKVVQFDVAALWNVEDLAHQLMVVRSSHPLAGFLGGYVLKCMVATDVFVTNMNGTPSPYPGFQADVPLHQQFR